MLDRRTPSLSTGLQVRKPAVRGAGGVVAAHHRMAAEVGAQVLRRGGHAVDAAVATAFAVGVVEPWMSGIGGVGAMLVRDARSGTVTVIDFGARSPAGLDPADYPIVPGADADLFGWPAVREGRNVKGPHAVAVPAMVAGHALAHATFGRLPWAELVRPAAEIAEAGLPVDWHTTLVVATALKDLAADPGCAELFLPGGAPPVPPPAATAAPVRRSWPALAATLRAVADEGPGAFYEGRIARSIGAEMERLGGSLRASDLAACRAELREPARLAYRGHVVHVAPELNGGPTLLEALQALGEAWTPAGPVPDGAAYAAFADALRPAWARRLAGMGDASPHPTSTTNLAVVDAQGNVAVVTQTLLSLFGARLLLPETGILLNNGINWFDPRPGAPNSIAPGKRVLSNYCPVIAVGPDDVIGLGGAGGRKIIPAMLNLVAFLVDHGMSLEEALHAPRVDVSGPDLVVADGAIPAADLDVIAARHPTALAERAVYPYAFTIASAVRLKGGVAEGAAEPIQPCAEAVAA